MKLLTVKDNLPELMEFWEAEKNAPRWFRDGNSAWHTTDEDFIKFCAECWRIYDVLNGNACLYVQKSMARANIHFSILPHTDTSNLIDELIEIRADIFCSGIEVIFGWVAKQNRGLRKICEQLGLTYYGFKQFKGESHGKVIEWQCYGIAQTRILIAKPSKAMLSLV